MLQPRLERKYRKEPDSAIADMKNAFTVPSYPPKPRGQATASRDASRRGVLECRLSKSPRKDGSSTPASRSIDFGSGLHGKIGAETQR